MSNDKLAINLRDFYLCLVGVGFQPDEALRLTERFVPEMQEAPQIAEPMNVGIDWGVGKSYTAPVTRPAQAESTTELPRRKSREEIEDALETLCDAIGVYGDRIECPVSLIFGNGMSLTEAAKGMGHRTYTTGMPNVRDWIYGNRKGNNGTQME
jgi:hypothetical protein